MIMGQGWLVYELSGSPLMLGYLGAAASLPTIIVTLFGGALADQMNKRHVLAATSLIVALLMLILGILTATGTATAWTVIIIAGLVSITSGLDWPTRQAVFPLLIDRSDMLSAVALNSIIWQSTRMVMPAFGGVLLAFGSTDILFLICSAGFFLMFVVVLWLKFEDPRNTTGGTLSQVVEGIAYVVTERLFLTLIGISFASMLLGTSYMQLMPAFSHILGAGEAGYGILISATGFGSIVGTVLIGSLQRSNRFGLWMLGSAAIAAVLIIAFAAIAGSPGLPGAFALALIAAFSIAVFSSMYMIASMTILQLKVPDRLRGRVMGLHGITYSLMPLGGLLLGIGATLTSEPVAVGASALSLLMLVIVILWRENDVRRIDGASLA